MEKQKMLKLGDRKIIVKMQGELLEAIERSCLSESERFGVKITRSDIIRKAVTRYCKP